MTTNHFYQVSQKIVIFKVVKMVDFDKSYNAWVGMDRIPYSVMKQLKFRVQNIKVYIKPNSHIHIAFTSLQKYIGFHLQLIIWSNRFIGQHDVVSCNVIQN